MNPSVGGVSASSFRGVALTVLGAAVGVAASSAPVEMAAAAVAGCLLAASVMRWREFALCLLLFTTYVRLTDGLLEYHGIDHVFEGIVGMAVAMIAYRALRYGPPRDLRGPLAIFGFFVATASLSLFHAADAEITVSLLQGMAKNVVVALAIIALIDRPAALAAGSWTLIGAGAFLGGLTAYQQLTATFDNPYLGLAVAEVRQIVQGTEGIRAGGPVASTNYYAMIMVALVPLALDRTWNGRSRRERLVGAAAAILISSAVLLTLSRGGLLAFGFVVVVMGLWRIRKASYAAVLVVSVIAGGWVMSDAALERFQTVVALVPGADTSRVAQSQFAGRASEMLAAAKMFADHPVLGVGLGNYNVHYVDYSRGIGLDPRREDRSAHSLYLEVAAEGGALGLIGLALLVGGAYVAMGRSRRTAIQAGAMDLANRIAALEVGIAGYLVASVLLHDAFPRYLWVLMALAYATSRVTGGMSGEGDARPSGSGGA